MKKRKAKKKGAQSTQKKKKTELRGPIDAMSQYSYLAADGQRSLCLGLFELIQTLQQTHERVGCVRWSGLNEAMGDVEAKQNESENERECVPRRLGFESVRF